MSDISNADSSIISSESGNTSSLSSMTENSHFSEEKTNQSPNSSISSSARNTKSLDARIADLLDRTKVCCEQLLECGKHYYY